MLNRVSHSGKRPISERISVFEQRQTTTTTTSITSHGVDRTGSTETTTSQRVTRVASPVTRTFSNKNFEDLKSAFSSPTSAAAAADLSHSRQAPPPPPIRIPGATPPPIKTVGSRTSVPLSPTQPAAPSSLEVFHPPSVAPQRSSVSLNVDSGVSSPSANKTPLKKTPSPSSSKTAAKSGATPTTSSSAPSPRVKSAKTSPQTSQNQRPSSRNSAGPANLSGRTSSRPAAKSSTTPIKPASGAMNINTMTINVKKSTVTELNGNVPGNSTTTTTTKVVRDRAVTAPLPSPPPTVVVTMEQPPPSKTLPHSQSVVKMESGRRRSEVLDSEKEVSVTKAEEEAVRGEKASPVKNKSEPALINAPKPIVEEDDDDGGGSDPESPPPVERHAPLRKNSGVSQINGGGGGGRSNGVLLHKDSNADFVDSLVNNKNRNNAHNLVGDTSTVTTMTAAVFLTDTATSTSPPPTRKSQSSSSTTSSGPGSNPNYWANQVSLQYENAQNTIEVQTHALLGLPELLA